MAAGVTAALGSSLAGIGLPALAGIGAAAIAFVGTVALRGGSDRPDEATPGRA
jgi:hypothetical protein